MGTSLPSTSRWRWPWSGLMRVVVWETILAPVRSRRTSEACRLRVWPLRGARMLSLAVEAGGAAGVVGAGVEVEPPLLEQAPRSTTARAARARRVVWVLLGWWRM